MEKKVTLNLPLFWLKKLDMLAEKKGVSSKELIRIIVLDYLKSKGVFS